MARHDTAATDHTSGYNQLKRVTDLALTEHGTTTIVDCRVIRPRADDRQPFFNVAKNRSLVDS